MFATTAYRTSRTPLYALLSAGTLGATAYLTSDAAFADASDRAEDPPANPPYAERSLSIVIVGALSEHAKRESIPALYSLFKRGLLPPDTVVYGVSGESYGDERFRRAIRPYLAAQDAEEGELNANREQIDAFLSMCVFHRGKERDVKSMNALGERIARDEAGAPSNRVFYLAVSEENTEDVARAIKTSSAATSRDGRWTRVVVNGRGSADPFDEASIYRMDHYLGMEMVQNVLVVRFANACFEPIWNRDHVAAVYLTYKDVDGCEEDTDVVRDVIQNHMTQILSLIAMEAPSDVGVDARADATTREKIKLLRCVQPIRDEDVVLARHDDGGADDANAPTFATVVLYVDNPRWRGVPFIVKAGKGMDQRKIDVRLQLKDAPRSDRLFDGKRCPRNEIVIRFTPNESIYIRTNVKAPGLSTTPVQSELDLTYRDRYGSDTLRRQPRPHARMLLNVLKGDRSTFVGRDELERAKDIFAPLLRRIDRGTANVTSYPRGSRGPSESDDLAVRAGYDASTIKNRLAAGPRDNRPFGGGYTARELKVYVEKVVEEDAGLSVGGHHMPECFD